MFVFSIEKWGLEDCVGVTMICNHYVLISTPRSNWESTTIISVEFADGVIPDMEFSFLDGRYQFFLFIFFFYCGFSTDLFDSLLLVIFLFGGSHSL